LIKTARSAVSKKGVERGFVLRRQPRNFENNIISALARVFPGFLGDSFGCSTLSKKMCLIRFKLLLLLETVVLNPCLMVYLLESI